MCDGDRCRAPGTRQCLVTSTLRAVASGRLTRTLRLALIPSHLSRVAWVVFGCLVALGAVGWFLVPLSSGCSVTLVGSRVGLVGGRRVALGFRWFACGFLVPGVLGSLVLPPSRRNECFSFLPHRP